MITEQQVLNALSTVDEPELHRDLVTLKMIRDVSIRDGDVDFTIVLTTPACPLGEQIVRDAEDRVFALEGVNDVNVDLVWEPPWSPERMSDDAKRALGWAP